MFFSILAVLSQLLNSPPGIWGYHLSFSLRPTHRCFVLCIASERSQHSSWMCPPPNVPGKFQHWMLFSILTASCELVNSPLEFRAIRKTANKYCDIRCSSNLTLQEILIFRYNFLYICISTSYDVVIMSSFHKGLPFLAFAWLTLCPQEKKFRIDISKTCLDIFLHDLL